MWSRTEDDVCWTTKDCYISSCMLYQSTITHTSLGWVKLLWKLRPEWPQIDNSSKFQVCASFGEWYYISLKWYNDGRVHFITLIGLQYWKLLTNSIFYHHDVCTYIVPKLKLHERYHTAVRNYLLTHYISKYSLEQIMFHIKFVGPKKKYNSSKSISFLYDEYHL